ncbi:MAG: hypothetical protein PHW60_03370 [Kiritimatiellae bacterium]|nr:hypothetical protein [Kiritimatiellia bacterium]
MSPHIAGLVIGGFLPAVLLGFFGVMQKTCMRASIGIGPFFVVVGTAIAGSGLAFQMWTPLGRFSLTSVLCAMAAGVVWSSGVCLVLLAVSRLGGSISQLAPLYNVNTLVAVALGLLIFSEWRQVRPVFLAIGAVMIVVGSVFAARASRETGDEHSVAGRTSPRLRRALIVGCGLMAAICYGFKSPLFKAGMCAGAGVGPFFFAMGFAVICFGIIAILVTGDRRISHASGSYALFSGLFFSAGNGLVLLAISRYGANISQLAPLYNMNTLVVVLLGLLFYSEWKQIKPVLLIAGAVLIVLGAAIVGKA